jgi:GT2 family glycosyltransferase
MDLSIIIVSYNVRYFLEQLLYSIQKASATLRCEVFVVDNQSQDDSVDMVRSQFPEVHLIANQHNPGFSIANNQALALATGKYILFLNPDTLLAEDTLEKCIQTMDSHPKAGALGVRMVDGGGHYLPESKRGLPTPATAFFKLSGINRLFPKSPYFNRYYLGHLPEDQISSVEVITGAFFFARKSVLDEIGGFDEAFFMYGEDIDLSYRVTQAGYPILYHPGITIIHYKGESTRKNSVAYIRHFYEAMLIFARKHFKHGYPAPLRWLLKTGVYAKAAMTLLGTFWSRIKWPVLDLIMIALTLSLIKWAWATGYHQDPMYYSGVFEQVNLPIFLLVWIATFYFSGVYDHIKSITRLWGAILTGLLINGLIYGMLDAAWRPSRPILLFGYAALSLTLPLSRLLWFRMSEKKWLMGTGRNKRIAILADAAEFARLSSLIQNAEPDAVICGAVLPEGSQKTEGVAIPLGHVHDLEVIIRRHKLDEVVIASRNLSTTRVLQCLSDLGHLCHFKLASAHSDSIIGSRSKDDIGELYTHHISYRLSKPEWRRIKRWTDGLVALFMLLASPLLIWFFRSKGQLLVNAFRVLTGKNTWIGYGSQPHPAFLPPLPQAIIPCSTALSPEALLARDIEYARYYAVTQDADLFLQNMHRWSQNPRR